MPSDLRDWLDDVDGFGELTKINGANWQEEIGALSALNYRRQVPSALLFDNIPGYPAGFRVLTGSMSSARRMSLTLRLGSDLDDRHLIEALRGKSNAWIEAAGGFAPIEIPTAAFQQNVISGSDIDLSIFPVPLWHERDGGRFIGTGDICITSDPETGAINGGACRVQLQDHGRSCTVKAERIHDTAHNILKWFAKEGRAPIVISFGQDPLLLLAAGTDLPDSVSELDYAGAVNGKPLEVVIGKDTGLPIPASSEIAIEGWLVEGNSCTEGPFGEWRGYYSGVESIQAVEISSLYYRNDPIILGSPPGKPPYDYSYMRSVMKSARIQDDLEAAGVPGVVGVWPHESGGGRMFIAVAITQQYAGHSRQAAYIASQCSEVVQQNRYVVVVDDDVDPRNLNDVIWAMSFRSEPSEDIEIMRKTRGSSTDYLRNDPTAAYTSRAIIDACIPFGMLNTFPKGAGHSQELLEAVHEKWAKHLFPS